MKYKGYTGVVEFDEESGTLFGRVIGLRDFITFQGDSVAEVTQAFRDSVDVYLELCAERGESPEKPYSGQFILRINPRLHREVAHAAEERGLSLNRVIEEQLEEAFAPAADAPPGATATIPEGARPLRRAAAKRASSGTGREPKVPARRRIAKGRGDEPL